MGVIPVTPAPNHDTRADKNVWDLFSKSPTKEISTFVLVVVLILSVVLVYSNTLHGPFQYDDNSDILENQSIRHLWPLIDVFYIPGSGFLTRPIANLSFALNYATGGINPFHYHLTNLGIHLSASLTLLGVMRRALSLENLRDKFYGRISTISLITAGTWALHPLQTESVSYITQRYESLMGFFVLLTFYAVLRMAEDNSPLLWAMVATISCFLALGSKEVAVSLPFLVLLFDRTYLTGSFRGAWTKHRTLYLGLLLAWCFFALIQLCSASRSFAGFGLGMPWWRYALNQPAVILHYLRLSIWPYPLNFDYFWPAAKSWSQLAPGFIAIIGLLGFSIWACVRKPMLAFLPITFFFILAPTSSVMPILDLAVEHRMYLPLAPVIVLIVLSGYCITEKIKQTKYKDYKISKYIVIATIAASISSLAALTYLRNEDFQDPLDLWRDAVAKAPDNPRAHHNYAQSLSNANYNLEAIRQFSLAINLAPDMPLFRSNYGITLAKVGLYKDSLEQLRMAIKLEPTNFKYYINLGFILIAKGSLDNAVICFNEALAINPRSGLAYSALSSVWMTKHEPQEALRCIKTAVGFEPQNADFNYRYGAISLINGDNTTAMRTFDAAIHFAGNPETMASTVGWTLHDHGMDKQAIPYLRKSLHFNPKYLRSQIRLAWILASSRDDSVRNGTEALALSEMILKAQPVRTPELLDLLGVSSAEAARYSEARAAIQEALAKSPKREEDWVPAMEKRLALFEKGLPYRELPKGLLPPKLPEQDPTR